MEVVANTTILSNFASAGRLDVLREVLGKLHLPAEVYAKIQEGLLAGYEFYTGIAAQIHPFSPTGWLRLVSFAGDEELRLFEELSANLGRGEAASLALAMHRGWGFLSDDARARNVSRNHGVSPAGTLGVLLKAVKTDVLSVAQANEVLHQMIGSGYRSPYDNLAELL